MPQLPRAVLVKIWDLFLSDTAAGWFTDFPGFLVQTTSFGVNRRLLLEKETVRHRWLSFNNAS